jgi:hypothetical protein
VQTGRGARRSDLPKAKGSVVEWTTIQLSVTKVGKWPGPAPGGLARQQSFDLQDPERLVFNAASGPDRPNAAQQAARFGARQMPVSG